MSELAARIDGTIDAEQVEIGRGVVVESGVHISGKGGPARRVVLGDFSFIGRESRILVPELWLGDYTKLHSFAFVHGELPARIGRNCWFGGNVVLDSLGGLDIDDNVGVGAQSQIWTHIQFGDLVQGCRFHSRKHMYIGKDAWFVGHCIVSPVEVGERSMALVGSVVTKNMAADRVYAGVPASDVTERTGPQFRPLSTDEKVAILTEMILEFESKQPQFRGQLQATDAIPASPAGVTYFDVERRIYNKSYAPAEISFLRSHVPLVKFSPQGEGRFWS